VEHKRQAQADYGAHEEEGEDELLLQLDMGHIGAGQEPQRQDEEGNAACKWVS